ncbi:hypothetical protein AB0H71_04570 [Nocardia sp. NPDC050697]|uniref:hypothetical protein n=1 Tax=Nocardia sp. NPDC050697 TaxID=3155158 RepID=UPI00340DDB92
MTEEFQEETMARVVPEYLAIAVPSRMHPDDVQAYLRYRARKELGVIGEWPGRIENRIEQKTASARVTEWGVFCDAENVPDEI